MARSRLRSKHNKWQSRENFLVYTKVKNYCNDLNKMTKEVYFKQMARGGFVRGKSFWNTVKPFLTKFFSRAKIQPLKTKENPLMIT